MEGNEYSGHEAKEHEREMAPRVGQDLGGVRTIADLKLRSRIDDETGCWLVRGSRLKGSTYIWCPMARESVSLTGLMAWVITGRAAPDGQMWVPTCGNTGCGNPAHRKLGTRRELMQIIRPKLPVLHKARITAAHQARSRHYSEALRAEILGSNKSGRELAREHGCSESLVSKVRQGKTWCNGSSVFTLGAA